MTMSEWNKRPRNPSRWDDEFESDLMHPKWVPILPPQTIAPLQEYPLDPHTNSTGDNWENVHRHKNSWWCRQSGVFGNNVQGYQQDISDVPDECVFFTRGGRGIRRSTAAEGDCEIMFRFHTDSFDEYVIVMWDCFGTPTVEVLFARLSTPQGVSYLNVGLIRPFTSFGEPIEYLAMHKLGRLWTGWCASRGGNWVQLGSFTPTNTLTKISITFNNATAASPGTGLVGIDFFRVIPGANLP